MVARCAARAYRGCPSFPHRPRAVDEATPSTPIDKDIMRRAWLRARSLVLLGLRTLCTSGNRYGYDPVICEPQMIGRTENKCNATGANVTDGCSKLFVDVGATIANRRMIIRRDKRIISDPDSSQSQLLDANAIFAGYNT